VRVIYQKDYHLDIPVYIMKDDKAMLAQTKANEWQHSDSKDFKDWFYKNRNGQQTNNIVRYLKAWRDYRGFKYSSIELTILAVKNSYSNEGRDDLSLMYTLKNINDAIQSRVIQKPVSPFENLWEELSEAEMDKRIEQLKNLYEMILLIQ
jgi:hypothetical protein